MTMIAAGAVVRVRLTPMVVRRARVGLSRGVDAWMALRVLLVVVLAPSCALAAALAK